ncbi:MAG: c-type cytochrome [Desulfobacterales bacterium]|nr:MAG: c-type cytochrome [Desulfobacterales bacterium]
MIETIYATLAKIGYHHPLHPPLTHLPVGLISGAFVFAFVAWLFRRPNLGQSARHCIILALIAVPPTVVLGFMDWQHRLGGAELFPVMMKLILAGILLVLLIAAINFGRRAKPHSIGLVAVYGLCLLIVVGSGYFGGELVYGGKAPKGEETEGLAEEGAMVFNQNCAACHFSDRTDTKVGPGMKGIFARDKFPVSGWPASEESFRKQLKTPYARMPAFAHLPEEKVAALSAYLKTL